MEMVIISHYHINTQTNNKTPKFHAKLLYDKNILLLFSDLITKEMPITDLCFDHNDAGLGFFENSVDFYENGSIITV